MLMVLSVRTTELRRVLWAGIFHLRKCLMGVILQMCSAGLHEGHSGTAEFLGCVRHVFTIVTWNNFCHM